MTSASRVRPHIKKLLTIGLFASVLHLAGDLILG